jgi:hypothetical protein
MRMIIRSLGSMCLALLSVVALAVAWTATTVVQLAATALIMGGTQHPLSSPEDPVDYINSYLSNAVNQFIDPASEAPTGTGGDPISGVGAGDDRYAVITPEQFFPVAGSMTFDSSVYTGLANVSRCVRGSTDCKYNTNPAVDAPPNTPVAGDEFVLFSYSQSSVIASLLKKDMIANPEKYPDVGPGDVSFFLLSNPMRPNGGFLSRGPTGLTIPILGVTFHGATPTNSCQTGECYQTVDVVRQYDGLGGDAAVSLLNPLAVINATMGFLLLHGDMQYSDFDDARYQGSYGDTDYYIVPTRRLPILMPFGAVVPSPILTALDAPLRVLIEDGYARDVNPGVATKVGLLPFRNPINTLINFLVAIPTGLDDAIAEGTGNPGLRPFGTRPVTSPFGVGGPELPAPPDEEDADLLRSRTDDDADTEEGGTQQDITEGDLGEGTEEDDTEETEEPEEKVTEKLELTVPGVIKHLETRLGRPLVRGPIKSGPKDETTPPSLGEPDNDDDGETATSEPDSTPSEAAA